MPSRRKFMGQAFSASLGLALCGDLVFPSRSEAQFWGALAEELVEGTMWLGKNLLVPAAADLLKNWIKDKAEAVIKNPRVGAADLSTAEGFSQCLPVPGHLRSEPCQPSAVSGRARIGEGTVLAVDDLPRLHKSETSPVASDLNFPEVKEFQNTSNPNLSRVNCGCLVRVPVTTGWRQRPSPADAELIDKFFDFSNIDGAGVSYVRRFCRCDTDEPLLGLAWKAPGTGGRRFNINSPSEYLA